MFRWSWSVVALLSCAQTMGRSCFTVAGAADLAPLSGCVALDRARLVLGTSDVHGLLCLDQETDTLWLEAPGHATLRVAMSDALVQRLVLLRPTVNELPALDVEPWPTARDRRALATTSVPDSAALHGFERSSLRSALIWAPGVQMDQRGLGGSTRLSIRGSLLRSPYGVRGVKVYWGPFPLTLADGSTPLELLDPALVDGLEAVRSVGSPVFGSAPAGLLLARPYEPAVDERSIEAEAIGGPDGYYRLSVQGASATEKGGIASGVLKQGNDGYRAQEWSSRTQAWLVGQWRNKRSVTRAYITGQQANWALPGSVDSLTAYTDPRAARPYSAQVNAHVEKEQLFGGLYNETALSDAVRVRTGLSAQSIGKINPYGTSAAASGYKDESILGITARLGLSGGHRMKELDLVWEVGLEALTERDKLTEYTYVDGVVGEPRIDAESRVGNLNGFAAVQLHRGRFGLSAAVGSERTPIEHEDILRDTTLRSNEASVLYPSVGLEVELAARAKGHVRYATSVSRPTLWELMGTNGVFNTDLVPEQVSELEAGIDVAPADGRYPCSVLVYWRTTEGLITARTAENGTDQVYVNTGTAHQNGMELTLGMDQPLGKDVKLRVDGSLALQHHRVQVPEPGGERPVPGVAPTMAGLRAAATLSKGWRTEAGFRYTSEVPAALMSDAKVPGANLLHLRIGRTFRWAGPSLHVFIHGDNLLDQRYTAFVQVNDPGGRYYNPAPGRSLFAGAVFSWGSGGHR